MPFTRGKKTTAVVASLGALAVTGVAVTALTTGGTITGATNDIASVAPSATSSASPSATASPPTSPTASPTASPSASPTASPTATPTKAACDASPTYTSTTTAFGNYESPEGVYSSWMTAQDKKWGYQDAVRVYSASTPPSNAWTRRAATLSGRVIVESFRMLPQEVLAGKHDAAILNWFKTAPTTSPIMWSYYHEPEPQILNGKFTAAQYRAAWQHLVDLSATVCKPNLYPTLILTGWTTEPKSKRDWRDYYPGDDYISVMAFDPYNGISAVPTTYEDPAELFGPQVAVAAAAGKPLGIAETGSMLTKADTTGSGRAAWLTKVGAYLKSQNAAFALYWDSTGNLGQDFNLHDANSVRAWKTVMQS